MMYKFNKDLSYNYTVHSGTCVLWTPWDQPKVSRLSRCPDYQGVLIFQVSLHDNVSFGTTARCVDAGVHIFKCPD